MGSGERFPPEGRPAVRGYGAPAMLFAVKAFHSLAFFVIQSAIVYLLYSGVRGKSDRRAAAAAGIAMAESIIYAANGFRCPLTSVAERLGAERGSVTDIFLPGWLARNVANIYTPMFALGLGLHAWNLARRTGGRRAARGVRGAD